MGLIRAQLILVYHLERLAGIRVQSDQQDGLGNRVHDDVHERPISHKLFDAGLTARERFVGAGLLSLTLAGFFVAGGSDGASIIANDEAPVQDLMQPDLLVLANSAHVRLGLVKQVSGAHLNQSRLDAYLAGVDTEDGHADANCAAASLGKL